MCSHAVANFVVYKSTQFFRNWLLEFVSFRESLADLFFLILVYEWDNS